MDTQPAEVGSNKAKPMNMVSPLQIIHQGCISYDHAINRDDEPHFDDILTGPAAPEEQSIPPSARPQQAPWPTQALRQSRKPDRQ